MAQQSFRITYATMTADNEELHRRYEEAVERARGEMGREHPFYINGEACTGTSFKEERSPIDSDVVIGKFAQGTKQDAKDAIAAARAFAPTWASTPWRERVAVMRKAAELISDRVFDYAAAMAIEVGKNRLEAMGDVQETADLIAYYCDAMERNEGFTKPMGRLSEAETNIDVLRPYGVWAVISPFNFPMALAGGPTGAALVAGNCVILKPASTGALSAHKLYEALHDAGVPAAAFQLLTGPGSQVGQELQDNPDVDGMTFTGSFGFGGQKCSATSRVYVQREVYDQFVDLLKQKAEAVKVGDPLKRENWLGPIITEDAVETFEEAAEEARKNGRIVAGGERLTDGDLARGNFVQPTVAEVPRDNRIWKKELFVPFVAVGPVDSLDEAFELANDTEYGLTAGFFSEDRDEVDRFLDRIEAGVVYVNRRAGATTGAWPGYQPFGGWKGSGTSGKAGGGDYYLLQYM